MKKIISILLSLLLLTSNVYADGRSIINEILNRKTTSSSGHDLINKALNKDRKVKIINNKEELKEELVVETTDNPNDYILGVDVSKWNGEIDWDALKESNIKFVIIRAGYGTNYVDPKFKINMENAIEHDMIIGVYWFSYAYTYQLAKAEADKCYKTIKPYKDEISLPVFWDFEYDSVEYANKKGKSITKKLASGMADTFCTTIKSKGLHTGIYCNIDYSQRYFTQEILNKYHLWIAQWYSECTYKDRYIIWQYSDSYYVKDKIFDSNRLYFNKYKKEMEECFSKNKKTITVSATAYSGDKITSTGTKPKWGVIAVDPSVIPYGSMVYIPCFKKVFIAEDCGRGIKGKRIDIFMNSESKCVKWGVRKIEIQIIQ